ncbi:MAG: hypothetical protein OEW66_05205, partial [Actinomycetota bacterium]|nr:hypothetical protein [Actinomycetota bacterium]
IASVVVGTLSGVGTFLLHTATPTHEPAGGSAAGRLAISWVTGVWPLPNRVGGDASVPTDRGRRR